MLIFFSFYVFSYHHIVQYHSIFWFFRYKYIRLIILCTRQTHSIQMNGREEKKKKKRTNETCENCDVALNSYWIFFLFFFGLVIKIGNERSFIQWTTYKVKNGYIKKKKPIENTFGLFGYAFSLCFIFTYFYSSGHSLILSILKTMEYGSHSLFSFFFFFLPIIFVIYIEPSIDPSTFSWSPFFHFIYFLLVDLAINIYFYFMVQIGACSKLFSFLHSNFVSSFSVHFVRSRSLAIPE